MAYLRAFGQAVRTQLRAYLEALLNDVESEWGQADPAGLPPVSRNRADTGRLTFHSTAATDSPAGASDGATAVPATRGAPS